jgi:hypothetical protein
MRVATVFVGILGCSAIAGCSVEAGPGGKNGEGGAGAVSGNGGFTAGTGTGGNSGVGGPGTGGVGAAGGSGGNGASGGAAGSVGGVGGGSGGDGGSGGGSGGSGGSGGNAGSSGTNGASGASGTNGASGSGGTGGFHGDKTCLKAGTGDYAKKGPYAIKREVVDLGMGIATNQATGQFTIFSPEPLEASCPHPIVAWGNGTGVTGADIYAFFNENAASWGVVVIAAHDSNTGSGGYHTKGLDYLLAENKKAGSRYNGKLSPRAGVSGHSQGGAGALRAITHPNVKAFVPVGMSGRPLPTTAFLCLTGTADIASVPPGCKSATEAATSPAFTAIWQGGDHVTTETLAGYITGNPGTIQMMRLYAAWFRCFLGDDPVACKMFEGGRDNCGICKDQGWAELVMKNL